MSDNIVYFTRKKKDFGTNMFLICSCQGEPATGMLPVVTEDERGVFISSLVCPECENELLIDQGRPVIEMPEGA